MTIEEELQLSYYQQVAQIEDGVFLVQDVRTKRFFVKKLLTVYNAAVYRSLQTAPIENVPKILEVVEDRGVLTVIEEYIQGDTLQERLDRSGVFSQEETARIATQLCKILAQFHKRTPAIINRDIKPENIKITPDGVVKLVDLNAAKWSDPEAARDTVLLGTQGYAAPEQYGFGPSGVSTDIYAVGVLINVMLTGQLPNVCMAEGRMGKIVQKCVELSPTRRFQTMDRLYAALRGRIDPTVDDKDPRRFLPPGFRRNNVVQWLFAAFGYMLLVPACLSTGVYMAGNWSVPACQITLMLTMLCIILFTGNYLGVHSSFVLTRSKYRIVRWLGIAIVDIAIFFFWIKMGELFGM